MLILVTGGLGYVGSHACVSLLAADHEVVVVDDLSNAERATQRRIEAVSGRNFPLIQADLTVAHDVEAIFAGRRFDAVLHFAARKYVAESIEKPLDYYFTNLTALLNVLHGMQAHGVHRLVFSSSAAVYGDAATVPIPESAPLVPLSPYARGKAMAEQIIADIACAAPGLRAAVLRYFNPVGAHPSGQLGEAPTQRHAPTLAQACLEVALGRRPQVTIFGTDCPTHDGTPVRDFIHVMDVAEGHCAALAWLEGAAGATCRAFNLGTGRGTSVGTFLNEMSQAAGLRLASEFAPRREGDIAVSVADVARASRELGWQARRTLTDMCVDALRWARARSDETGRGHA